MNVNEAKANVRQQVRAKVKALTPDQRAALSGRACALLQRQTVWEKTPHILFYAPLPDEVNVWPLIGDALAAGKTVALPRFDEATGQYVACEIQDVHRDLQEGQFGIHEPGAHCVTVPPNRLDLVLVPGVAFDLQRRRLGRGKGFYDQMLASVRGTNCGVAFDEQIVESVPVEPHDVQLNCILTPTRWIQP